MLVLAEPQWRARQAAHEARVDAWLEARRTARERHGRPAVGEFLFTYYSYRPAQLRRWQPGLGVAVEGADPAEFGKDHRRDDSGRVVVDLAGLLARRRDSIAWIHRLLTATAGRPAHLGCFGLHEWAMVYRQHQSQTRHQLPLRLGAAVTTAVVDMNRVRCSHFDAFRFFTPPARSLNQLQPQRETQHEFDQPGCLHANMDVYRWAYKLAPLLPAELVADCFELSSQIRVLDMQASPYDLSEQGFAAVAVETPDGRAQYARRQGEFADLAQPLRSRVIHYAALALAAKP